METLELFPESEELTLYAGASPANPSHTPGSSWARRMTVISGLQCLKSSSESSPLGSLEKMLLASSEWNSTRLWLTWRVQDTPAGRSLFRLLPLTPPTVATGSGLWATPIANNSMSASLEAVKKEAARLHPKGFYTLATQVTEPTMWPTPTANEDAAGTINGKMQWMLTHAAKASEGVTQGGGLNPEWVEWLMGFPIAHTALEPWEMPLSLKSQK